MRQSAEQQSAGGKWEWLWGAAAIALLAVVAYGPALRAGFIWDDDDYVSNNPTLRSVEGLKRIWTEIGAVPQYYPVTHTSFWLEYRVWGAKPGGYHLTNVALHAISAVLVWRLLARLGVPGAWVAGALFAVHPVNVESVAWVTERKNTLSLLFYLLAGWAYLRFVGWGEEGEKRQGEGRTRGQGEEAGRRWELPPIKGRRGVWWVLAFLFFLCALGSKTVTSTWPAAVAVVLWWRAGRWPGRDVLLLLPFVAAGLALARVTGSMEVWHVGARGPEWGFSWAERVLIAGRAVWWYAASFVFPWKLTFIYPRWGIDAGAWWQWGFPVMAGVVLLVLWGLRKRIGRGAFAVAALFVGTLTPALGFFNVYPMRYSFVADHFMYHATVFGAAGLAALGYLATRRMREGRTRFYGAAGVVVGVCAVLTFLQARVYFDLETLWRDTLAKNPSAWVAHMNLGGVLLTRGEAEEAAVHFRAALKLRPTEAGAANGLGEALLAQGKVDEAIGLFREAARAEPYDAVARDNLGTALREKGDVEGAIRWHRMSLAIQPDRVNTRVNLANAYVAKGDLASAEREYRVALELDPNRASLRNGLGIVLASKGQLREAFEQFRQAVALEPGSPESRVNLGRAYEMLGDGRAAEREYLEALRLRPGFELAVRSLQRLRGGGGR